MSVSANTVKELREKTNAGMMDCKRALEEAGGNMDGAVEILRKRGLALAQKKAGRSANEGILGYFYDEVGKKACLVEVNCETDFVVKTKDFQDFVSRVTGLVREKTPKDLSQLLGLPYDEKATVEEAQTRLVAKIGENIQVKRFVLWETKDSNEVIGFYLHAGSKIGTLVAVADPDRKTTPAIAKEAAMHVAAMHPQYVRPDEIPPAVLEKEKEILRAGLDPNKPAKIQDQIIEGKLRKFYSETCLEEQIFVKDPEGKKSVKNWLKSLAPAARIVRFVRIQVGT